MSRNFINKKSIKWILRTCHKVTSLSLKYLKYGLVCKIANLCIIIRGCKKVKKKSKGLLWNICLIFNIYIYTFLYKIQKFGIHLQLINTLLYLWIIYKSTYKYIHLKNIGLEWYIQLIYTSADYILLFLKQLHTVLILNFI